MKKSLSVRAQSLSRTRRRWLGWSIHAFTASGACFGLLSLYAIYQHQLYIAFWLMGVAILIDAVDGMFARMVNIKEVVPEIDGTLLDNIVDFVNYVIVPCFFLVASNLLADNLKWFSVMMVIFASTYQFTQIDAKTDDHFFKGFPSYWNIAVFYLFCWQLSPTYNAFILIGLSTLSFIPIKYVYPSRLDYLTHNKYLRFGMICLTLLWGLATSGLLWLYPLSNIFLVLVSVGYVLFYIAISLYRTWVPLRQLESAHQE